MPFDYTLQLVEEGLNYGQYRSELEEILSRSDGSEEERRMRPYVSNNLRLMEGFDTAYRLGEAMREALTAAPPSIWLVLSEGWCGDAAYCAPLFALAEKSLPDKLKLRFLFRDSHPSLMDAHLTDGGRSIPKLICLDRSLNELWTWGPRPSVLHGMVKSWRNEGMTLKELIPLVHDWYMSDGTLTLQQELSTLIRGKGHGKVAEPGT